MFSIMKRQNCYNYSSNAASAPALQNPGKSLCLLQVLSSQCSAEGGQRAEHIHTNTSAKSSLKAGVWRRVFKSESILGQSQSPLRQMQRKAESNKEKHKWAERTGVLKAVDIGKKGEDYHQCRGIRSNCLRHQKNKVPGKLGTTSFTTLPLVLKICWL